MSASDARRYERYAMVIAAGGSTVTGLAAVLVGSLSTPTAFALGGLCGLLVGAVVWKATDLSEES